LRRFDGMALVGFFFVPEDTPPGHSAHRIPQEAPQTPGRSEVEILQAMASGSLRDQRALLIELEALRGARTASLQEDRDLDLAGAVIADHLTPVLTHEHHTAATDWVLEDDLFAADIPQGDPAQNATVEASMWFGRVSPEVKADREEFAEQAMGMARVVAGKYGESAGLAERAFLDHVSHLHGKTANEIDGEEGGEWPLDPGGPMKPSIETGEIDNPAIKQAADESRETWTDSGGRSKTVQQADNAGTWPLDPNTMEKPNVLPWDAPPETTGDAHEAVLQYRQSYMKSREPKFKPGDKVVNFRGEGPFTVHNVIKVDQPGKSHRVQLEPHGTAYYEEGFEHHKASRTAAGDSPGKWNPDQSGEGDSTITDYDSKIDQKPWLFDDWPEDEETGPVAVHPPMPGAGETTAAKTAENWEMHNPDMDSSISHLIHVHHFRPDDVGLDPEFEHKRVHKMGPAWKIGEPHTHAASKTAADEWEQAGEGASTLPQVGVTDPQAEETMWPWEIGEAPEEGGPGPTGAGGQGAADVANVPTPGGEAGYPQPKNSRLDAFRARVQQGLAASR
jgi:hypothetical protein